MFIVPLKQIEYGVYGDLIMIYAKPCSIYLRGTYIVGEKGLGLLFSKWNGQLARCGQVWDGTVCLSGDFRCAMGIP